MNLNCMPAKYIYIYCTGGIVLVALCWWHCAGGIVLVALYAVVAVAVENASLCQCKWNYMGQKHVILRDCGGKCTKRE